MGIFFTSTPAFSKAVMARGSAAPTDTEPIRDRITEEYKIPGDRHHEQMVQEVGTTVAGNSTPSTFSWGRFTVAVLLLVAIGAGAVYTAIGANKADLKELNGVLVHSFELLLGALVGLLTGESVHR